MAVPAPFREQNGQFTIALPGARAAFTTRRGGVSEGAYASLNLGFGTADEPGRQDANRVRLGELIGAPPAAWMYQVHSDEVAVLDDPAAIGERPRIDGRATRLTGVALGALGADCLTVAVAGGGAVAVAHAGWRGLAAGVLGRAVDRVRELGADPTADCRPRSAPARDHVATRSGPRCMRCSPTARRRATGTTSTSPRSRPRSSPRRASEPSTRSGCARSAVRSCSSPTAGTTGSPAARRGSRG